MPSLLHGAVQNGAPEEENPANNDENVVNSVNSSSSSADAVTNGSTAHAHAAHDPQHSQQVRETTQTDHINKKLLTSFLTHINSANVVNEQEDQQNNDEFE